MSKKLTSITAIIVILCSVVLIQQATSDPIAQPSQIKIYVGPPSVPADNSGYNCVYVQLQDSNGKPARATQDTNISLSSSLTEIGTVDPTITILRGSTYGAANFYSTFTPGTTSIAATATGYATVQTPLITVGAKPSAVAVYGFPSILPADVGSYDAILVQLQDSTGSPAKAPRNGIRITLSCSDTNIGTINSPVTIPEGQTYTTTIFNTTTTTGSAVITPVAGDLVSKQTTITTKAITASVQLGISLGAPKILADSSTYKLVAVQMIDDHGNLGAAPTDITVSIATSDKSIGSTETQITIPQSKNYALATLTSTYKAGTTTITAAATNLAAAYKDVTSAGFNPSQLAVYCVPPTLPSDKGVYQVVQVQLQDSQGHPAKAPETDIAVNLFSSQPTIAAVSPRLIIPLGKTCGTGTLTTTNAPGETSVTAQASGYATGQATVVTHTIDASKLSIAVTGKPASVVNGNMTEITAYVTGEGKPIAGVTLKFSSNNGGTFSQTQETQEGYYKANFTAPNFSKTTACTITAVGSKDGFLSSQGTGQITVTLPSNITVDTNSTAIKVTAGTLQFCIQDTGGNNISDVIVSALVGTQILSGVTNQTGYATFKELVVGNYTFQITKAGYEALNQTVEFTQASQTLTLTLNGGNAQGDNTLTIIIVVVLVVVFAIVGLVVVVKRRKKSKKPLEPLKWPPS